MTRRRRIGVTQRVEDFPDRGERRDAVDQRWAVVVEEAGLVPIIVPNRTNDVRAYVDALEIEGFLLTGGNDLANLPGATNPAPERDSLERALIELAIERELPLLGVCRGMHMLAAHFGALPERAAGHVAVEHDIEVLVPDRSEDDLLGRPKRSRVNSYHDFVLSPEGLSKDLSILALADDGSVEAFSHATLPLVGIMWHPERGDLHHADLGLLCRVFDSKQETR